MLSVRRWAAIAAIIAVTGLASETGRAATFEATDTEELIKAMEQAEASPGPDIVKLAAQHTYTLDSEYIEGLALPPVTDELRIAGRDSTFVWLGRSETGFFEVARGGILDIDNLTLSGSLTTAIIVSGNLNLHRSRLHGNATFGGGDGGALRVLESGKARVFRSVFETNVASSSIIGFDCGEKVSNGGAIFNNGTIKIYSAVFLDNRAQYGANRPPSLNKTSSVGSKIIPTCSGEGDALYNTGTTTLVNTILRGNGLLNFGQTRLLNITASDSILANREDGRVYIRNSVVADAPCRNLTSRGHNMTANFCQLDHPSDKWMPIASGLELRFAPDERLPVLVPGAGSPLLDAAETARCPKRDALGAIRPLDGDRDSIARCDVGALEFDPGSYQVDGRIIGLWYEPDRDGHYLLVEQPEPDHLLVFWATYDGAGNPLWLYGTGKVQGDRLSTTLIRQSGMRFGSFDRDNLAIRQWGEITIEFKNCAELHISWQSDRQPDQDGEATLTRLTQVDGKGCLQ